MTVLVSQVLSFVVAITGNLSTEWLKSKAEERRIRNLLRAPVGQLVAGIYQRCKSEGLDFEKHKLLLKQAGKCLQHTQLSAENLQALHWRPHDVFQEFRQTRRYTDCIGRLSQTDISDFDRYCLEILTLICRNLPQTDKLHKSLGVQTDQNVSKLLAGSEEDRATQREVSSNLVDGIGLLQAQTAAIQKKLDAKSPAVLINGPMPLPSDDPPLPPPIVAPRLAVLDHLRDLGEGCSWLAIRGTTGMGKTYLSGRLYEQPSITYRRWVSLRTIDVSEMPRYVVRHLASWAAQLGDVDVWSRYLSGGMSAADVLAALAGGLSDANLLVVDNLPDLSLHPDLCNLLTRIAGAMQGKGLLITSGHHSVPSSAHVSLHERLNEYAVAGLEDMEVAEILLAHGSPPHWQDAAHLGMIQEGTQGHPSLVCATAVWLREAGWPTDEDVISSVLQGVPGHRVREEADKLAYRLIADAPTRELLDRLSLVQGTFTAETAHAVAAIDPQISSPVSRLNSLVGVWISGLHGGRYQLTPLLENVGNSHLHQSLQTRIHSAIADTLTIGKVLGPAEAFAVAMHLLKANEWLRLIALLVEVLQVVETAAEAKQVLWATILLLPDFIGALELPDDVMVILRALQLRSIVAAGTDRRAVEDDLYELAARLEDAGKNEALAAAYGFLGVSQLLPPLESARFALLAANSFEKAAAEDAEFASSFPRGSHPEGAIWASVPRLASLADITQFAQLLEDLDDRSAGNAFSSAVMPDTVMRLADLAWRLELGKEAEDRDWRHVWETLDRLQALGSDHGFEWLALCVGRARAITAFEEADDYRSGLEVLAGVEPHGPDQEFVLCYTKANLLFDGKDFASALEACGAGLALGKVRFPGLRFELLRTRSRAAGELGEWDLAANAARQAYRESADVIAPYSRLEMLGEIAAARWELADHRGVLAAMYALVLGLKRLDDRNDPRFRETFRKTGHALGWFASMSWRGVPPKSPEPYVPPALGFFARSSPLLADAPTPISFGSLFALLGELAGDVGARGRMIAAAYSAGRLLEDEGNPRLASHATMKLVPKLSLEGRFTEALDYAITGLARLAYSSANRTDIMQSPTVEEMLGALHSMDPDRRTSIEKQFIYILVVIPATLGQLTQGLSRAQCQAQMDSLAEAIDSRHAVVSEHEHWQSLLATMRAANNATNASQLRGLVKANTEAQSSTILSEESAAEHAERVNTEAQSLTILFLHLSAQKDVEPREVAGAHAAACEFLVRLDPLGFASPLVLRFVEATWREIADHRSFLLGTPRIVREALATMPKKPDIPSVAALVLAAVTATGAGVSRLLLDKLRSLADTDGRTTPPDQMPPT